MPPAPEAETRATLAGPLCDNGRCTCASDPAEVGQAPDGYKRFEVTLGPSQSQLWAMVDDMVLYKGTERATECYYLDLPQGEHPFRLHAKGKGGFGARMRVREVGAKGPWFFESFEFSCGAPGLCDQQSLREWKERIQEVEKGKHDPCGSVRVLGLDWQTGRMPDNLHPADFDLQASFKVYKFVPDAPPGDASCAK